MAKSFYTSLDLSNNQILNTRLQNIAGDHANPALGQLWYDTVLNRLKIRNSSANNIVPFVSDTAPITLSIGQTASIGSAYKAMREDATFGLPGYATSSVGGFMSAADKTKLDNATSSNTANTLALRDANGRFQVSDPVNGQDVANFQWTVDQISKAKQGLSVKNPVRTIFVSNLSGTYATGTKRITASAVGIFTNNDSVTSWVIGDRVCLNGQTTKTQNGLYKIVNVGSASTNWILERTDDFGGPNAISGDILSGSQFVVSEGTEYGDSSWVCSNNTVTIDSTNIVFSVFSKSEVDNTTIEVNANNNLQVKDGGISYAKIQAFANGCSILGRSANSAGVSALISASSNNTILARISDALTFTSVTNPLLAAMVAKSVKVNASNASASPSDLAATAANQVLLCNSSNTGLEWSTIRTGSIADNAVTYAKMQDITSANRVLGAIVAGDVIELTPAQLRSIIGSDISSTATTKITGTLGDGVGTSFTVNHSLGINVVTQVHRTNTPYDIVDLDITLSTTGTTFSFSSAPTSGQFTYVIVG